MTELEKVIRGLRDIDMFIAGRLGHEQAKNFLRTIDETITLLKEQEEKQEGLPPAWQDRTQEHICQRCGGIVWQEDNYCSKCGQAVKWT